MRSAKTVALIVAHPDDETLWAGGTMLGHPSWQWFTLCLCRGSDKDRSAKFYKALKILKSEGIMGDLDDSPEQAPMDPKAVEKAILYLMPPRRFDIIITHSPAGEYTKHIRHEEVGKAVISLWNTGRLSSNELWTFAYEDGNKEYYPKAIENASIHNTLTDSIWLRKSNIISETYGFAPKSWELQTTPKSEAFWQFNYPWDVNKWLKQFENVAI